MCIFAIPALLGLGGAASAGAGAAAGAASAGTGAATALQALGLIASAGGTIASGMAQKSAADYNAQIEANNAKAARQAAAYEAGMIEDDKRRVLGAQRAGGVSAGLDITQGTPLAVFGDSAKSAELDILSRKYAGEAQATAHMNNAALQRAQGKAAMTGSLIGAGTSILGGFGRMYAQNKYSPLA